MVTTISLSKVLNFLSAFHMSLLVGRQCSLLGVLRGLKKQENYDLLGNVMALVFSPIKIKLFLKLQGFSLFV